MNYRTWDASDGNYMVINGTRYPVINSWVETESSGEGRKRWGIVTGPEAEVQPAPPAEATAPLPTEAELADRMFGAGTAQKLVDGPGCTPVMVLDEPLSSWCGEPLGGNVVCARPPGHEGEHGTPAIGEAEAIERARAVWPEAEGFLPATYGWTFRVGGGYASITSTGVVAREPQGTRFDAVPYMGQ